MGTRMVPTPQPPPPVESSNTPPEAKDLLDVMLHKLRDLIFDITLSKMRATKTTDINIKVLCLARDLAGSACEILQEHHRGLQLDDISRQLEDIKMRLCTSGAAQAPQKPSYATTLSTGIKSATPATDLPPPRPSPAGRHGLMLIQKSCDKPIFVSMSNEEVMAKVVEAIRDAGVWLEERPSMPDSEG